MPTIVTRHAGYNLFESEVGEHVIESDVPLSMGGADRAPTPPHLFITSIGACIGNFVLAYCIQAGLDSTDLRVEVDYEMAQKPTRLTNLKARVILPNEDLGARLGAVYRAAEQCPVHATINLWERLEIDIRDRTNG